MFIKNIKHTSQILGKQKQYVKTNFSWDKMKELVGDVLDKNIPDFPKQVELELPKLNLPKLQKVK